MKEYSNLKITGAEEPLVTAAQRWFTQHGYDLCAEENGNSFILEFKNREDIPNGGFNIRGIDTGAIINASCMSGKFAGLGQFLRGCVIRDSGFIPPAPSGTTVPEKSVRMMYFATHFHNFYHDAPVEKVEKYVYDLAMYGYNALMCWFDMHHYSGIDELEAQKMIARLKRIFYIAECCGMAPALVMLANEGFSSAPEHLKADGTCGHDGYFIKPHGFYNVQICPSTPGGTEYILTLHEKVYQEFLDINFKYISIWPYDQGGCTCSACAPWGANGFLKLINPIADLTLKYFKDAKIICRYGCCFLCFI